MSGGGTSTRRPARAPVPAAVRAARVVPLRGVGVRGLVPGMRGAAVATLSGALSAPARSSTERTPQWSQ
jgi:hypothetical protein